MHDLLMQQKLKNQLYRALWGGATCVSIRELSNKEVIFIDNDMTLITPVEANELREFNDVIYELPLRMFSLDEEVKNDLLRPRMFLSDYKIAGRRWYYLPEFQDVMLYFDDHFTARGCTVEFTMPPKMDRNRVITVTKKFKDDGEFRLVAIFEPSLDGWRLTLDVLSEIEQDYAFKLVVFAEKENSNPFDVLEIALNRLRSLVSIESLL